MRTPDNPQLVRFQVTTDAAGQPVVLALTPKKERREARLLRFGSVAVPYQEYRNASGRYYMLSYYQAGRRRQECRTTFAALKVRAEQIATNIANGTAAMNAFTEQDRARWLVVCENFAKAGIAPETGSAEYAELCALLHPSGMSDQSATLQQAVRFFLENRPRGFVSQPLPKLVDIFLTQIEGQISKGWHAHLSQNLRRLAGKFTCPLHALQSADLNDWLRGLKGSGDSPLGARTRHNYRGSLDQLVSWAHANNHLPRTWREMEQVEDPGHKTGEVKILTPEQIADLLSARQYAEEFGRAQKSLIPFLALQAFAGIRHQEMNGEKAQLDWRDVHLAERYIYVPKGVAKTGLDRTVPISDNLAAWLEDYAKRNGPVVPLAQTSGALTKAKKSAGIPAGDNQTRNVLRKSFISYRLAVTKSIAQVAEEAGNSPGVIRKHYKRPIPEAEGKRWFAIHPPQGKIRQVNFAFS